MSRSASCRKFGARYPWDVWFSLGEFTLVRGNQYQHRTDTMALQVRRAARNRNIRVQITVSGDLASMRVLVSRDGCNES